MENGLIGRFSFTQRFNLLIIAALLAVTSGCGGGGGGNGTGDGTVNGDENQVPVASAQSIQATESTSTPIALSGADGDGDTLSYSIVDQPDNGQIQGTPPALTYLPNQDFIGTDTFTFKVNDGTDDSELAEISIEIIPTVSSESLDALIEVTRSQLESQQPPMTNEAFSQTEYSQNLDSSEEQQRVNAVFALIDGAEDPDPEWFATRISEDIIIGSPGESYTVNAKKIDINGEDLGAVDFDKIRLVVKIQTDANSYESISDNDISSFVEIDRTNGNLTITPPATLTQGRLLIGLRPKLEDAAQNALAERWSAVITVEIWPLQPNVIPLSEGDVLFPLETTAVADNSKFSIAEIKAEVEAALVQDNLYLPLVVNGKNLDVGQLLDYRVAGFPYGGQIEKITVKDDQQLILLSPAWQDVYQITEAETGFLRTQGVLPEDVIYQNNEPDITPSTKKAFSTRAKGKKTKLFSFFRSNCEGSLAKHNLSFKPSVTVSPMNASLLFSYSLEGSNVSCTWKAEDAKGLEAAANLLLMGSGGPVTIALRKLLGTDIEVKPHGSLKLSISTESSVLLGIQAGWSLKEDTQEKDYKGSGSLTFKPANIINNAGLTGDPVVYSGDGSIDAGIKFALNILSEDGVVGWAFTKLSIEIPDIGIKASTKLTESLSVDAANIAAVYQNDKQSSAAVKIDLNFQVGASDAVIKAANRLSKEKVNLTFEKTINLLNGSFDGGYIASDIEDDFQGAASVGTLKLKNVFLNSLFSSEEKNSTHAGIMGAENTESSVFADGSKGIGYDLQECEDVPGNQISAPVIACEGIFCGKSNEVKICGERKFEVYQCEFYPVASPVSKEDRQRYFDQLSACGFIQHYREQKKGIFLGKSRTLEVALERYGCSARTYGSPGNWWLVLCAGDVPTGGFDPTLNYVGMIRELTPWAIENFGERTE